MGRRQLAQEITNKIRESFGQICHASEFVSRVQEAELGSWITDDFVITHHLHAFDPHSKSVRVSLDYTAVCHQSAATILGTAIAEIDDDGVVGYQHVTAERTALRQLSVNDLSQRT